MLQRRALLSLALSLTLGIQAAHGAPLRATQVLQALQSCATKCPRRLPVSETTARRCCEVAPTDVDSAAKAPAPHLDAAPAAVLVAAVPAARPLAPWGAVHDLPRPAARAAPVFLLSLALRL
jgi:hypothetical protein